MGDGEGEPPPGAPKNALGLLCSPIRWRGVAEKVRLVMRGVAVAAAEEEEVVVVVGRRK